MKKIILLSIIIFSIFCCKKSGELVDKPYEPILFTVIGDVPYNDIQREGFVNLIAKHNAQNASEFIIHVGDIKSGKKPCNENVYQDVSTLLKQFTKPTFIVLGDNEYNDCDDSIQALAYWNHYFLHLNENWNFAHKINYQNNRTENFSWIQNDVLFIGLNIVGSTVHNADEWQNRLTDNGNWVKQLLEINKNKAKAVIIFAHANMVESGPKKFKPFTDLFRAAATRFNKPILYIQGDGHSWINDKPWQEQNIMRVQIIGGVSALKVTVNTDLDNPFLFDSNFLK